VTALKRPGPWVAATAASATLLSTTAAANCAPAAASRPLPAMCTSAASLQLPSSSSACSATSRGTLLSPEPSEPPLPISPERDRRARASQAAGSRVSAASRRSAAARPRTDPEDAAEASNFLFVLLNLFSLKRCKISSGLCF